MLDYWTVVQIVPRHWHIADVVIWQFHNIINVITDTIVIGGISSSIKVTPIKYFAYFSSATSDSNRSMILSILLAYEELLGHKYIFAKNMSHPRLKKPLSSFIHMYSEFFTGSCLTPGHRESFTYITSPAECFLALEDLGLRFENAW